MAKPKPLPSLGSWVCDFIEAYCVHGPGDVRGDPVTLTPEQQRFIYKAYEIWPKGHPKAGRRRWRRATYSRRKGVSKSELDAFLTAAELLGEVRFDGWRKVGRHFEPVPRPILSPYIPVAATAEEQAEDTLWGAFHSMVVEGPMCDEFALDIGKDRIINTDGGGEAKVVTSRSITKDGGKPTFSPRDETHLWYMPDLKELNETLIRNLAKRPIAEPWGLATTTMFKPGQGSVAEDEWDEAEAQKKLPLKRRTILFDHLDATGHDMDDDEGLKAGLAQASGDALHYTDLDELVDEYRRAERSSPGSGKRFWGNLYTKAGSDAINMVVWDQLADKDLILEAGDVIALGFDGSESDDSSALWACRLDDMALFKLGLWERPHGPEGADWRVPRSEVESAITFAYAAFKVVLMFADPWGWRTEIDNWAVLHGGAKEDRVLEFPCNQYARMVPVVHEFVTAMAVGAIRHEDDEDLRRHIGHATKIETRIRIEDNTYGWVPAKRSQREKIDAFLAALLAKAAADKAIAEGLKPFDENEGVPNLW